MKTIAENKIGRYIKYALGEIVLVVLGILIALQINTWNIERNNSKQEIEILKQLQNEFQANLVELNGKISMRKDMVYASEIIVTLFDNGIDGISLDTLQKHVTKISLTPTFNPAIGVTNELINSGKLYLIKNQDLKTLLTNWSGDFEKLIEIEMTLYNLIRKDFMPYFIHNYRLRHLTNNNANTELYKKIMIGNAQAPNYKGILNSEEYEKFFQDVIIENFAVNIGEFAYFGNRQSAGIKERIDTVLKLIDDELKKKIDD